MSNFKHIYIDSIYFKGDVEISSPENIKDEILSKIKKQDQNLMIEMFDLEYIDEDNYSLILNRKGEFLSKIRNGDLEGVPSNVRMENLDRHITFDILIDIIERKDFYLFMDIIDSCPKCLFIKNTNHKTCLFYIIENNILELFKELLNRPYVDINRYINYNRTPLSLTSEKGHLEMVHLLLENDVMLYDNNYDQYHNPLSLAAYKGHLEIIRILLEYGGKNIPYKDDALSSAVFARHLEIARLLLKNGAEHYSYNELGYTTLHFAVENGDSEMIHLLLENGAKQIPAREGETPLSIAINERYLEIVELLKKHL